MRGSKNIRDVGRVVAINGERILKIYKENEECNVINGTDAMYFPPFQRRDEVIWAFSDSACKSFPLRYKYKTIVRGIRTHYKYLYLSDQLVGLGI